MAWDQIEATPPHISYLILSLFLIWYTLFATFIRNRLHLSEPPIALIVGILLGPQCLGWLSPNYRGVIGPIDGSITGEGPSLGGWGWGDDISNCRATMFLVCTLIRTVQETTRVIVGIQVFAVGVELPKFYASRHRHSVAMMLGPVMAFGWLVSMESQPA